MKHQGVGQGVGGGTTVAMSGGMAGVWWMGPWCHSSAGQGSSGNTWFDQKSNYSLNVQVSLFFLFFIYLLICFSAAHLNP